MGQVKKIDISHALVSDGGLYRQEQIVYNKIWKNIYLKNF